MAAATLYLAKPCFCSPKIPFAFNNNSRVSNSSRFGRFGSLKPKAGLSDLVNIVESASSYIQLELHEPSNALSLPTWAVHVSSVVEWIIAMALVWQYGEKSGYQAWKGLSWGMVLVALQAALTVIGNVTMCIAAYRIYKSSRESSENF
ncbi:uncharacterized protein [Cicer arietinum]|uniref:uncharacterized protein isoform X2 n=1 Tax=Cicer arietinum TaxID=3827 RepID=UPI003CC681C5